MSDCTEILLLFVIASMQYYYVCHAEQNIENTLSNRTARSLVSSWIYIDPTDVDPDTHNIFQIATQITNDIKRGRFDADEGYHTNTRFGTDGRFKFTQSIPPRLSPVRPAMRRPPTFTPVTSFPPRLRPISVGPAPIRPFSVTPALQRPASQRPALQRPVPQRPVPQRPAPQRLVPQRPVPQRPAPQRPVPQRPAPQRPVPQRPAPQRPASQKPTSVRTSPLANDTNPCNWKVPEKPNFFVRGRRISDAKCAEFQWTLKQQDEKAKKVDECKTYKKENGIFSVEDLFKVIVVGGRQTEPGEFPHTGALGWRGVDGNWKFKCGATLISERFLLTAAHCSSISSRDTSIVNTKPEIVRLGVSNLHSWPNDVRPIDGDIAQIIVHPRYNPPMKYYDIALVKLKIVLAFVDTFIIQPACLWTRYDTSSLGNRAFTTGWGYVDAAGTQEATELQVAEVDIINPFYCDVLLSPSWNRNFYGLTSHQMCAGVLRGGVDACQGDSGGPLQVKISSSKNRLSYVIGVTSFGKGCGRRNSPGVYTRVSSFIDWIENIVWPG